MVVRPSVEQSRERLVALVLLLQRAYNYGAISQEEILRELMVDELSPDAKVPRKVPAYQGGETAMRQKFERDKAKIRELGFDIETISREDGSVGYRIDPTSGYAPPLHFDADEARVVALALRVSGLGRNGVFSVFSELPPVSEAQLTSNFYTPVLRALKLRRVLRFDYFSSSRKTRTVQPLVIEVVKGVAYLVARIHESDEIKGYRLSRITSMPTVLKETFEVDDAVIDAARAWRPEFQKSPRPIDVVISTSRDYSDLLRRQYPDAEVSEGTAGRVNVAISCDGPASALGLVLDAGDRARLISPKSLKSDLARWLSGVNRGDRPTLDDIEFPVQSSGDVLGQTLQLLHAVYASEEGLRISELARRFSLDTNHVRLIMDRLVSLEPMSGSSDGTDRFPAHVIKECDDWDDELHDDSLYVADFSDIADGSDEPSAFMWRDLFELNLALREATSFYNEPAIHSAIEKIESVTSSFLQVDATILDAVATDVQRAVREKLRIKVEYVPVESDVAQVRSISPRDVRILNGLTYVLAYCHDRGAWRTFRLDRMKSVLAMSHGPEVEHEAPTSWLSQFEDEGDEVVVVLEAHRRWCFEGLPGATWTSVSGDRLAVRFRVSRTEFLDHLMVRCGPGAVIVSPDHERAGLDLAQRMLNAL